MEPNYFTCTLGQAAALGIQQPHKNANALIDALAGECPHQLAVGFPQPGATSQDDWRSLTFTFSDIRAGRDHVAATLLNSQKEVLSSLQTVALLCPSTPEFLFTWLALMRLGHAVLLIAPQCQPVAIASLCKTCDVNLLFYDDIYQEQSHQAVRYSTLEISWDLKAVGLPFPAEPEKATLVPKDASAARLPEVKVSENDVAYLHHTSGTSSGMPKPIPQTHHGGIGVLPSLSTGSQAATFTTTPLFHGGVADIFRAWTSKALIWLFPGKKVPITGANILKCLDTAKNHEKTQQAATVKYFSSVPYVLQMLEADPKGLSYLQSMSIVGVGGAALPAEVGQKLVEKGINLISRFGSAECGFLISSHRDYEKDKEWHYLRVAPGADKLLRFEPQADEGLAELVIQPGWPHMAKRNRDDGSFATSDLFAPHPSIQNAWRYHSRADSQLTLITGKKFDPAPLEASIATSPVLDDVLIFGNGRPYPGALLFRSSQAKELSDSELLEQLWPAIEKLNLDSQDHARLSKSMLKPMDVLSRPLEKSSKGTLLRGTVEKRFAQDIENTYDQVDGDEGGSDVPDQDLPEAIHSIVRSVIAKDAVLNNDTDLFSYGVDSVAGMQIRGKLRRLLPKGSAQMPINVVEDCGNIVKLAEFIKRRRAGETGTNESSAASEHEHMLSLVDEYSHFENPQRTSNPNGDISSSSDEDVIVLTGATGALGAHVLDQYRKKHDVKKIYCLVRGADEHAAYERVSKALVQRKLQPLSSEDTDDRVVVLQATLGDRQLGLSSEQYAQLAREATIVMHVAWSVNFRMKLRSFVKDNIAGVTNLLNLALASPRSKPPSFGFCSSVASAMSYWSPVVPEEIIQDPTSATELGYSQSKWVAEHICQRASNDTRLNGRVSIFRVGQLAGDTANGVWNTKEAWPMMLSAVKVTGSLPNLQDKLDWLPGDIAADALIQGVSARHVGNGPAVYHVVNDHDRPTWSDLLAWLRKKESLEAIPPAIWVEQLEKAIDAGSNHPSGQLLDHWRQAYCSDKDGGEGPVSFAMERTRNVIPALRGVEPVNEEYFAKLWTWIRENM
ncbi:hypothetical protein D0862_06620 [Hortaea werneckii]|uniref:Carrier domain-containing protein n=1 Tax=Hortaea werneckii TaxID=91943 RepID=A0A3M7GIN4_HORWE|nr:hypothetical protein D0862_06620 [Hortaea werneckii]